MGDSQSFTEGETPRGRDHESEDEPEIIGYAEPWIVSPGQKIDVKVYTQRKQLENARDELTFTGLEYRS